MKLYIDTENKIIHCYDVTIPAMDQIKKMIEAVGGDPKDYRIEQQYNYQPYVQSEVNIPFQSPVKPFDNQGWGAHTGTITIPNSFGEPIVE